MAPKPPSHLSKAAKRGWRALQSEYSIDDGAGLFLLNIVMESWDQAQAAREIMVREGYVIENDSTGNKRAHPAAAVLKEARQSMLKALAMLNLDISAMPESKEW